MFKRTTGQAPEDTTRVVLPRAVAWPEVRLWAEKSTRAEAQKWADDHNVRIATLREALMDAKFIRNIYKETVWVAVDEAVPEGCYRIDRSAKRLVPISDEEEALKFPWSEHLVVETITATGPGKLVLLVGDDYCGGGLWISIVGGRDDDREMTALV